MKHKYELRNYFFHTRFEAFRAVKFDFFWFVTQCSVVVCYQRFRGPCCVWDVGNLHQHSTASQRRSPRLAF